jgi:hypothetical protein
LRGLQGVLHLLNPFQLLHLFDGLL